ncbi:MAG: SUMF1/EgtB/PvdO family nonheme iron enzyme [Candidatus Aminicenantes bacterium]|nr:SUMF1/EgtB/PvdO family nonheme iron enzyme [Candidatus Aminicenantes bacterium]
MGNIKVDPFVKNPNLANYGDNIGSTTPVGRYPEGATPEGLMDMAGNAWEWMDNCYDKDKYSRALRGGSWDLQSGYLPCVARYYDNPQLLWSYFGFRVVCVSAPSFEKLRS